MALSMLVVVAHAHLRLGGDESHAEPKRQALHMVKNDASNLLKDFDHTKSNIKGHIAGTDKRFKDAEQEYQMDEIEAKTQRGRHLPTFHVNYPASLLERASKTKGDDSTNDDLGGGGMSTQAMNQRTAHNDAAHKGGNCMELSDDAYSIDPNLPKFLEEASRVAAANSPKGDGWCRGAGHVGQIAE